VVINQVTTVSVTAYVLQTNTIVGSSTATGTGSITTRTITGTNAGTSTHSSGRM
jgi:hypothetical protein